MANVVRACSDKSKHCIKNLITVIILKTSNLIVLSRLLKDVKISFLFAEYENTEKWTALIRLNNKNAVAKLSIEIRLCKFTIVLVVLDNCKFA